MERVGAVRQTETTGKLSLRHKRRPVTLRMLMTAELLICTPPPSTATETVCFTAANGRRPYLLMKLVAV